MPGQPIHPVPKKEGFGPMGTTPSIPTASHQFYGSNKTSNNSADQAFKAHHPGMMHGGYPGSSPYAPMGASAQRFPPSVPMVSKDVCALSILTFNYY
jgi:hypothetical protein